MIIGEAIVRLRWDLNSHFGLELIEKIMQQEWYCQLILMTKGTNEHLLIWSYTVQPMINILNVQIETFCLLCCFSCVNVHQMCALKLFIFFFVFSLYPFLAAIRCQKTNGFYEATVASTKHQQIYVLLIHIY